MSRDKQKKARMQLNTLIDIEETRLRLELQQNTRLALEMLMAFRPGATLRQIKNSIPRK